MSYFGSNELTDQYLTKLYDDCMNENQRLLTQMKNVNQDNGKNAEQDIQKQLNILNHLMTNALKLKNLRKKIAMRIV